MGEARDIEDMLPEVLTYAPNCPEPFAIRHIRAAAAELCKRGKMWRATDEIEVEDCACADDSGIFLTIEDASIFHIEWAKLGEETLEPVTVPWLDRNRPGWSEETEQSSGRYITQLSPNTVAIVPRVAGTLKVRYVLYPSNAALTLPDFLIDQYKTEIGTGAASRILMTPGDYANPQLGAAMAAEFRSLLNTVSVRAAKGQQNAPLRTVGAYF